MSTPVAPLDLNSILNIDEELKIPTLSSPRTILGDCQCCGNYTMISNMIIENSLLDNPIICITCQYLWVCNKDKFLEKIGSRVNKLENELKRCKSPPPPPNNTARVNEVSHPIKPIPMMDLSSPNITPRKLITSIGPTMTIPRSPSIENFNCEDKRYTRSLTIVGCKMCPTSHSP